MIPIRIAIADNHPFTLAGVTSVLSRERGVIVVGTAQSASEAVQLLERERVDILIADLCNRAQESLTLVRAVRHRGWSIRIIILTAADFRHLLPTLCDAGATDFLFKEDSIDRLVQLVRIVGRERSIGQPKAKARPQLVEPTSPDTADLSSQLTPRERQVLSLVVAGGSNQSIARALQIHHKTVNTHRTNLYRKLGVHSVGELVAAALRHRLTG
jgi:DNA-binding NarL/FixJ family response regulator